MAARNDVSPARDSGKAVVRGTARPREPGSAHFHVRGEIGHRAAASRHGINVAADNRFVAHQTANEGNGTTIRRPARFGNLHAGLFNDRLYRSRVSTKRKQTRDLPVVVPTSI